MNKGRRRRSQRRIRLRIVGWKWPRLPGRKWGRGFGDRIGRWRRWIVGGLVVMGLIGGFGVWRWLANQQDWNRVNRLNVLVLGENRQVGLVSYAPMERKMYLLWLGGEVQVSVVSGYGQYRLGVLRDLGIQEGRGVRLAEKSLEQWLGVAINGSVTVRELMKENFLSVNKVRWQILRSTNGSLSLADKIHFFQVTADVGRGSVEMVDLTEGGWFVSEVDVSGNEVVMMSTDGSETITRNYLQDEQVVMSVGRGVAVVNATNQEGLATRAASVAEAMGYDVLSVINTPEKKAVTELRVMGSVEEQGFYTYPLERVFGVQARVDEKVESEYRADVVLIVGDDYYDLMYKKTKEW